MHIELTEMLRCPEPHQEEFLVLSTGEMLGRMVRFGILGCPVCHHEYPITKGIADFTGSVKRETGNVVAREPTFPVSRVPSPDPPTLQALLELSGPGGYVVLLGGAARRAVGLAGLMAGIHFVGINAPPEVEELPVLSLLLSSGKIPLRHAVARGVVVGADLAASPWLVEAHRILLCGRRFVVEHERPELPIGLEKLAGAEGLWVGEKK
ncbi:MAG TPA: hypothetical protein VGQ06_16105 [Gemmatimonadales bacterium]|jgi:uncharacterized protein YbaR (Trm112 family)|nr:hypothetical protein [Gemmatimonadales bacterium]